MFTLKNKNFHKKASLKSGLNKNANKCKKSVLISFSDAFFFLECTNAKKSQERTVPDKVHSTTWQEIFTGRWFLVQV